jgi:hypothetical protein
VYGIYDAGGLMVGPIGNEVLEWVFFFCKLPASCSYCGARLLISMSSGFIFPVGSADLGVYIVLEAVTGHGSCTQLFVTAAAVSIWILASISTLSKLSWLAIVSTVSILASSRLRTNPITTPLRITITDTAL